MQCKPPKQITKKTVTQIPEKNPKQITEKTVTQIPEKTSTQFSNLPIKELLGSFKYKWEYPNAIEERKNITANYVKLCNILNEISSKENFQINCIDPVMDFLQLNMFNAVFMITKINEEGCKDMVNELKKFTNTSTNKKNKYIKQAKKYIKSYNDFKSIVIDLYKKSFYIFNNYQDSSEYDI